MTVKDKFLFAKLHPRPRGSAFFAFFLLFFSFADKSKVEAATTLRIPVLLLQNGQVREVQDYKESLRRHSIRIPEFIEINLLKSSNDILPELLKSVERLSQNAKQKIELLQSASLRNFTDDSLGKKLCFSGDPKMALRLLPQLTDGFFASTTVWLGYRLKGQNIFVDFNTDQIVDLREFFSEEFESLVTKWPAAFDIEVLTKTAENSDQLVFDTVSACPK